MGGIETFVATLEIESEGRIGREPVTAREQFFKLPDEFATAVVIDYYSDVEDALVKALAE